MKSSLQKLEEQIALIESGSRPKTTISLLGRGIRYLSMREYSEFEIRKKLAPFAPSSADLEGVIEQLKAKNFLSNERFSESLVHRKAQGLGIHRVAQELRRHDVGNETVAKHVNVLKSTEFERAYQVWQKKFGTVSAEPKEKARQIRFMVSRGFDQEMVYRIVRGKTLD